MQAETRTRPPALAVMAGLIAIALVLAGHTTPAAGEGLAPAPVVTPAPIGPALMESPTLCATRGLPYAETAGMSGLALVSYTPDTQRFLRWQAAGIRFEGNWRPGELALILRVLDRFASAFGQAQVLALVRLSLSAGLNSEACYLSFIRVSDPARPPGCWAPETSQILINDTLYDQPYLDAEYAWAFLENANRQAAQKITHQEVIVAHELGHVLVEGMRLRREQGGTGAPLGGTGAPQSGVGAPPGGSTASPEGMWLEELYAEQLNTNYWPHPFHPANENLATEVGVWALAVPRQQVVVAFREKYLSPLIYGRVIVASR